MVHASEKYIHFSLMHTTDHIFPMLPIKQLVNQDSAPNTSQKLVSGTKPSVSNPSVLFCTCVVRKATLHIDKKALNMRN